MTMTMKSWLGVIGVGLLVLSVGCTERAGIAPTELASNATVGGAATSSTSGEPTIIFWPDQTADPAVIWVQSGQSVLMVNNSSRYVSINSYNCTQFSSMGLQAGVSRHTMPFYPAGKRCDYFVWDKYPKTIFNGTVFVQ